MHKENKEKLTITFTCKDSEVSVSFDGDISGNNELFWDFLENGFKAVGLNFVSKMMLEDR